MSPDLESDIRRALRHRGEQVTRDRVRYLDSPPATTHRASRTRWAVVGPIAAAAVVAAIAVGITALTSGGSTQGNQSADGHSVTSLVGTSWTLTTVHEAGHAAVTLPRRIDASVAFERGGAFSARDGVVNSYQATYKLSADGDLLIADASGTAAGYAGHDPAALAAINGIQAILSTPDGQTTSHRVAVHYSTGLLQLTANSYTLTLNRPTPAPTPSSAPPSPAGNR